MPFTKVVRRGTLLAAWVVAAAGCSDFGHILPAAMVIREGSNVLVHARGTDVDGRLQLHAGDSTTSLTVGFLDGRGTELRDPGYRLGVLSLEPEIAKWEHDSHEPFTGRVLAGRPGTTTLLVQWLHGGHDAHKDREWPVTVTVLP